MHSIKFIKSCTISRTWLHAPTMGIIAHGSHSTPCRWMEACVSSVVACHGSKGSPMATWPSGCLWCMGSNGALSKCTWIMVQALNPDLQREAIRRELMYRLIALCRDDNSKHTLRTMGENQRYSKDGNREINKLWGLNTRIIILKTPEEEETCYDQYGQTQPIYSGMMWW
jgi:hypothetical protein